MLLAITSAVEGITFMRNPCLVLPEFIPLFVCALILGSSPALAQKEKKGTPEWKPAILPADALAYGAALNDHAPPKLKAWCEEFARKEMAKHRIDPRETMGVVDKQFPKNSDEARDAAIYLVSYLSYVAEDDNQGELAHLIRQVDGQMDDIQRQVETLRKNDQNRMGNTRAAQTPQQVVQEEEKIQKMEQQLRELDEARGRKIKELSISRKRVDGFLKVLDVTHKRMNGIEPSILSEFQ
jgi:hypothetical protein